MMVAALGAVATVAFAVGTAAPAVAASTGPRESVIVRAHHGELHSVERTIRALGGHLGRELGLIDAVTADVSTAGVAALEADPQVLEVTPNATVKLDDTTPYNQAGDPTSLYNIEQQIGARSMWSAGYIGAGVSVALIDSGVNPVYGLDANGKVVYGPDLTPESQNPDTRDMDTFGHGTHLAGIIAGRDDNVTSIPQAVGDTTDFLGVAPRAQVVSVKVADYAGNTDVSQVIAGIDWVVQHAHDNGMNIRVMNLSFGTPSTQSYTLDPLAYAAEQAWRHGIVVVVSAGNSGTALGTLTDPAIDPYVIAVGAADDTSYTSSESQDTVAPFSSQGNGVRNPDLVAPGAHVLSLRDPGSYIDTKYGSVATVDTRFFRGSGTSQAAAVVSGAAALVLSEYPGLTPDQVKALLVSEATPIPGVPAQAQGAGVLHLVPNTPAPFGAVQTFAPSTGTGTLEGARGGIHLVLNGVTLSGEQDIFGQPVNTTALAALEAAGSAWTGGTFNGTAWTGSLWTTLLQSPAWSSVTWTSSSWASSAWSSSNWADGTWSSSAWSSSGWSGATWQSSAWSSSCWSSSAWSSSAWSSSAWSSSGWSNSSWP
jgi:serine protease AprX